MVMDLRRLILGLAVITILLSSMIVLAVSLNSTVKGIAAGEATVEKTYVRVVGVDDLVYLRGANLIATAVNVVVASDRYGTYKVVLALTGKDTTTTTTTIEFSGTTTVSFMVTMTGLQGREFDHRVEVSPS
ncbi:MAG: hypothetical protein QXX82_03750 [Nitrososphaerota archaeon]